MRCIIFDMWGTLMNPLDEARYYRLRVEELLKLVNREVDHDVATETYLRIRDELDRYRRGTLNEVPALDEILIFFRSLGIEGDVDPGSLLKAYSTPFLELTDFHGGILEELYGRFKVGVLSNSPYHGMVVEKLKREGAFQLLDAVVTSENVGRRKPSPEPFRAILEALGCQPQESLMVGDSEDDSCGAHGVGMRSVMIGRGRCGDFFIKSLDELLRVVV